MIRFITTNARGITPDRLPPEKPDGRLRLLIVTMKYTGLRSIGLEFEKFCASRDDVDAVSILFDPPRWVRAAHYPTPLPGYDYSAERQIAAWRLYTRRWYRRTVPLARFDAVHCTQQLMALGVLDRRRPGAWPVVCPQIDATTWNMVDEWNDNPRWSRPMIGADRRIFRESELIASTSEWVNESLVRRYSVPREKIVAAPPTSEVLPRPDLAPGRPIPDRKPRILFVGNNWERKGGQRLLEIHQRHFRDRAELHAVSRERPAETTPPLPGVVWHGQVPRDRLLSEIVPNCDLFCMPSQRDTSCWPAVEAQGAGLPVVVPRMTGIPDLVEHEKTGFVVDTTKDHEYVDAIGALIGDRERCREMGRAGQDLVRRCFTREVVFGRIVEAMKAARARVGQG